MRKSLVALAIAGCFAAPAFAQSTSVTLYGLIDETIHEQSHVNQAGNSKLQLDAGAFNGNRVGFKGTEDLGGGMSALFQLENGFNLNTGTLNQGGRFFGRQAFVGLSFGAPATVTLGRQYTGAFQILGNYDPLQQGNWTQNSWEDGELEGVRQDNVLQYSGQFGPVQVLLQHAFGGVAGSNSKAGMNAGGLNVALGIVSFGLVSQSNEDNAGAKEKTNGLGFSVAVAPVTLYGSYVQASRDPGFAALGTSNVNASSDALLKQKDKYYVVGGQVDATAADHIILGYMHDKIDNLLSTGASGTYRTIYAYYQHDLSKRTTVYLGADAGKASAAAILPTLGTDDGAQNLIGLGRGQGSGTDFGLGLRHRF